MPKITLPAAFQHQMQTLLGGEWPDFESALQQPPPVCIRVNPLKKLGMERFPAWADLEKTPHSNAPIFLPERPVFALDPLWHAGAYYVQEASSIFLGQALTQVVDFSQKRRMLDLCAAPGGKSTLLASLLNPDSLLLSNEVIRSRLGVLRENLERWGAPNVAISSGEAEELAELEGFFDVVVTDAPCSGEGLFRKDPEAIGAWSTDAVALCSARQRRILAGAVQALAPGGILAYSTCTYNRLENEDNVDWLAAEFGLEKVPVALPQGSGIVTSDGGYRFYPHRVRGEGFFLALLRKPEGKPARLSAPSAFRSLKPLPKALVPAVKTWLNPGIEVSLFQLPAGEILAWPSTLNEDFLMLDKFLKIKWFGTAVGELKGKDFVPAHALALNALCSPALPGIELDREQALLFLKKETFALPPGTPNGWLLARFAGLNLGWLKALPNRMNNYLPAERRLRMEIHPSTSKP